MFAVALRKTLLVAAFLFAGATTEALSSNDLTGVWVTDDGLGAVEFVACGAKRCGRIVWLKNPCGGDGKPLRDVNNPDAKARERMLCGLEVVRDLQRQDDGSWDNGTVYDPDEGKTYSVAVKELPGGNLQVTGYWGSKILSETMIWKKRAGNKGHCSCS